MWGACAVQYTLSGTCAVFDGRDRTAGVLSWLLSYPSAGVQGCSACVGQFRLTNTAKGNIVLASAGRNCGTLKVVSSHDSSPRCRKANVLVLYREINVPEKCREKRYIFLVARVFFPLPASSAHHRTTIINIISIVHFCGLPPRCTRFLVGQRTACSTRIFFIVAIPPPLPFALQTSPGTL